MFSKIVKYIIINCMTKKKDGPISWYERMHNPELNDPKDYMYGNEYVYDKLVDTTTLVNGVLVTNSEVKKVDCRDNFKGFHYYDFSIDSLAATGNVGKIGSVSKLSKGSMAAADSLDSIEVNNSVDTDVEK